MSTNEINIDPSLLNKPVQMYKPTVIFCIPGNHFSNKFFESWTLTIMNISHKYNIILSNQYSSQVNFARALCLGANVLDGPDQKPFGNGKHKYDVIMWLDSDMVFMPQMIDILIEKCIKQYKVVSGIYAMDGGQQLCCVKNWDEDYYKKNGTFQFLSVKEGAELVKTNKNMLECAYVGMGCMAMRYGVLEDTRFKYPWFFRNITSFNDDGKIITEGTSEDVSFIRNMIDSGIITGVMVDLSLRFGHEKSVVY